MVERPRVVAFGRGNTQPVDAAHPGAGETILGRPGHARCQLRRAGGGYGRQGGVDDPGDQGTTGGTRVTYVRRRTGDTATWASPSSSIVDAEGENAGHAAGATRPSRRRMWKRHERAIADVMAPSAGGAGRIADTAWRLEDGVVTAQLEGRRPGS